MAAERKAITAVSVVSRAGPSEAMCAPRDAGIAGFFENGRHTRRCGHQRRDVPPALLADFYHGAAPFPALLLEVAVVDDGVCAVDGLQCRECTPISVARWTTSPMAFGFTAATAKVR